MQSIDQPVNIAVWRRDEEFEQYPEGARDKTLVYCPAYIYTQILEKKLHNERFCSQGPSL